MGIGLQAFINRAPKGPCPLCGMKMDKADERCPHCNYQLSNTDRIRLIEHLKKQQKKGMILGAILFPCVMLLVILAKQFT